VFEKEAYFYVQTEDGKPQDIIKMKLHATTGYSISRSSTVSTQPVSDGSDKSDHYTNNMVSIRLSGVIADQINPFRFDRSEKTSTDYVEEINSIIDKKKVVTVVLPELGLYKDCMIADFNPSRRTQTGLGTSVSLSFKKILIATVGTVKRVKVEEADKLADKDGSGNASTYVVDGDVYVPLKNLELKDKLDNYQIMEKVELSRYINLAKRNIA